jgi:hypothetical protein
VVASHVAVSAALVQEKQDGQIKKQAPVYFITEVLSPSKNNYTELQKVLYAVLMASRKLRHYFQAYHIIVPTSQVISGHVDKSSKARDPKLEKYLDAVRRLEASFEGFSVKNIPRGENEHVDLLAKSAT